MRTYDHGDIATFYFILFNNGSYKQIQAWTDDKKLAKFYMEFHHCKRFELKVKTGNVDDIYGVTDENVHNEIGIANIIVRNYERKSKKDDLIKQISIPATETEISFIRTEEDTCLSSRISYSALNEAIPYMKGKYKEAMSKMRLDEIIEHVLHGRPSKFLESVQFDELLLLYKSFPDMFG